MQENFCINILSISIFMQHVAGSHPQFDFHFAQMLAFAAQTAYTCTGGQESPAPEYALYFEEKTAAGGN
jgi:hypothetical protein